MSLKLHTQDLSVIDNRLADKVQQAPGFFKDPPVVVDLTVLDDMDNLDIDAAELLDCIRRHNLIPIVASVGNKSSLLASSIAIPLIESSVRRQKKQHTAGKNSGEDKQANIDDADDKPSLLSGSVKNRASKLTSSTRSGPAESAASDSAATEADASDDSDLDLSLSGAEVEYVIKAPMFINRPVRSGQQIYARDTDLIVMGQIGPGAEVIADNNIHVYGPLRGRALCGVSGNTETRIFCQSLEAELVSVAGNFRLLEEIPEDLRGKPAQIWLENDKLNIEPL